MRDVKIAGVEIPARLPVTVALGAANHDGSRWEDPERFDIARTPNPHHAFAGGKHICLGATLSKIEGRIAVGKFIERFANARYDGVRERLLRARFRGYARVPVAVR